MAQLEREKAAIQTMMQREEGARDSAEKDKDRKADAEQAAQDRIERVISTFTEQMGKVAQEMARPKKIVKDKDGSKRVEPA
jgi:hypothetical protein